jgi:hypothetical protein
MSIVGRRAAAMAAVALVGIAAGAWAQTRPSTLPSVSPPRPTNPIARPKPLPAPAPIERPTPLPAPQPGYPGPGHNWDQGHNQGRYFAGTTRCESQNFRPRTCRARTQNRVEIVQVHGGSCSRGRSFRYDANSITVTDGCRATFAYGFGNVRPKADNGSSALPWLLAGAGATAGIVAIANSGNDKPPQPEARPAPVAPPVEQAPPPPPPPPPATDGPFPSLPPAKIVANTQMLTADQQRTMQTCLFEGARQVGIAGGNVMTLTSVDRIEQGNGGWRFNVRGTATFPNGERGYTVFCRATPTQIVEFSWAPA